MKRSEEKREEKAVFQRKSKKKSMKTLLSDEQRDCARATTSPVAPSAFQGTSERLEKDPKAPQKTQDSFKKSFKKPPKALKDLESPRNSTLLDSIWLAFASRSWARSSRAWNSLKTFKRNEKKSKEILKRSLKSV